MKIIAEDDAENMSKDFLQTLLCYITIGQIIKTEGRIKREAVRLTAKTLGYEKVFENALEKLKEDGLIKETDDLCWIGRKTDVGVKSEVSKNGRKLEK